MTKQTETRSHRGAFFTRFVFRVIPLLLVLAAGWTLLQTVRVYAVQTEQRQRILDRQDAYAATATMIAPDAEQSRSSGDGDADAGEIHLVQFATNTPDAPLPTATPEAPQATDIPATLPPADQRTPIPLPTFFRAPESDQQQIAGTAVPTSVPVIPREYDLVNILLLGTDEEIVGDSTLRTDTMIIVSINTDTGTVSMLTLPRDLFVYVPTPTLTRLNTVYGIGEAYNWSGGGFGLMRQTIFYNFGIQLHYYALVNISGLRQIVDTLGGVDIAVNCTYRDYALVGADVPQAAELTDPEALEYTLPVGYYHFTGGEALWYARTRGVSDDFDRGRRQQKLLRAIFSAARDNGQLQQIPGLWNELTQVVETDLPLDVVLGLLPIALNIDSTDIESFVLVRTYHTTPWQPPSGTFAGQYVQLPNYEPIQQLLLDFYQPPTDSQVTVAGPSIAVYNGTPNDNWDIVAAETLRSAGLNAYAAGAADRTDYADSQLRDYVDASKGSPVPDILDALNMTQNQITIEPNPNRDVDYELIVGTNYDSCDGSVVEVD